MSVTVLQTCAVRPTVLDSLPLEGESHKVGKGKTRSGVLKGFKAPEHAFPAHESLQGAAHPFA